MHRRHEDRHGSLMRPMRFLRPMRFHAASMNAVQAAAILMAASFLLVSSSLPALAGTSKIVFAEDFTANT